jgi:ADP-ribose pyrophosphatase YjhB (NUDIX family)
MDYITTYAAAKHLVAVDCIVFGFDNEDLKILLVRRPIEPQKGDWSLMGGFVQEGESLDDASKRVLFTLTGLSNVYLEQLYTFGDVHRDPVDRVISVAYYALIKINDYDREIVRRNGAQWFKASAYPKLIFDHDLMVQTAINKLRRKCRTQPIGFELLPEKFTIPQLQSLYEAILMQPLDKRNFRKKILSMNLLDKLDEKDKENSKKGAYLYRFNREKYEILTSKGFSFEI